jgi:hypothetical protein
MQQQSFLLARAATQLCMPYAHHLGSPMLADFRFVLGAILAVTMLAVAGLGVATSLALMREAHVAPVEGSRSLAYAGPATRNEFYDPDALSRFERSSTKTPEVEPAAEIVEDKEPEASHATEAISPPAAMETLATPPAERVVSAPAAPVSPSEPGPPPTGVEIPPTAVPPVELQAVPQPRPKPLFHRRVARAHIRRAFVARQQAPQYPPFGWQPFGSQLGTHSTQHGAPYGTTTAWRNPFGGPFRPH